MKTIVLFLIICLGTTSMVGAQPLGNTLTVEARRTSDDPEWKSYSARTVDRLPGFRIRKGPETDQYGGWKVNQRTATGYFRTEKIIDRWWIIDPEGYPFIHKGIAVFTPGGSDRQMSALEKKFGTRENWAVKETEMLREYGFNGAGAWSNVELLRNIENPPVYTIILSPMGSYRSVHRQRYGGKYLVSGWQGYRFDLIMVFDPEFDQHIEKTISPIIQYQHDKYLLGYFTDNELPWKNDALDRHLKYLARDEPGYLAAKKWLDTRKGKDSGLADISDEDRQAFTAFYFETYIKKVSEAIRKYDPNHMYLGCRFNQEKEELQNPDIFRVAGNYSDIISINHYRKWEPVSEQLTNWTAWSGKPFIITEWYTKGEDSGLPNKTGAGWNVRTQQDRGYFYQNFTIELLKSKNCVGWHWFTYQDNDPLNLKTDPSNRDSNKGVVDSEFNRYQPLLNSMKMLNDNVFNLINYFDK